MKCCWLRPLFYAACLVLPILFLQTEGARADDGRAAGLGAFAVMAEVMQHARCLNCHTATDRPSQGEDRHVHQFGVRRGVSGRGVPGLRCHACHGAANFDAGGVPGAPHWRLAPASAGWGGLEAPDLCTTLRDPTKNGGMTPAQILRHVESDLLIRWAWQPGYRADGTAREAPSISHDAFVFAVSQWALAGAPCP